MPTGKRPMSEDIIPISDGNIEVVVSVDNFVVLSGRLEEADVDFSSGEAVIEVSAGIDAEKISSFWIPKSEVSGEILVTEGNDSIADEIKDIVPVDFLLWKLLREVVISRSANFVSVDWFGKEGVPSGELVIVGTTGTIAEKPSSFSTPKLGSIGEILVDKD